MCLDLQIRNFRDGKTQAMSNRKRTEIGTLGEFGLIEKLTGAREMMNPTTIKGVGDDAAVIDSGGHYTLVTTDMMIESMHFDLMYTPLKHLGYKAVVSNLSDIYAMNGLAEQITVSIGLSNRFSVEAVEELYKGIYAACKNYNIDLIGGDTSASSKGMIISITALGRVKKDRVVYRSGARPGDILAVTGDLGAAYLGLQLLEREKQIFLSQPDFKPDLEDKSYIVGRQLKPEARGDMIATFEELNFIPTSMIDISDGLASEIFHICRQSNTGVEIEEAKVPIADEAQMTALEFHLDPITCALNGGEDYELLFTADPDQLERLRTMPGIYIIGEIKPKSFGKKLLSTGGKHHDLQAQGWQHFAGP
jgi:thiamine-monophosphate kinase